MKVIGITGGIGSGKSIVSDYLESLGAVIISADKIGHEALKPDSSLWQDIVETFGQQILTQTGKIDRKKLGQVVFSDPQALSRLNHIVHPWIYKRVKAELDKYREQGTDVVVLEAAVLIEAKWYPLVDEVWMVEAPESTVVQRLQARSGLSEKEALSRIRAQMSNSERAKHADVIIYNDGSIAELKAKVDQLWQKVHNQKKS